MPTQVGEDDDSDDELEVGSLSERRVSMSIGRNASNSSLGGGGGGGRVTAFDITSKTQHLQPWPCTVQG